MCLEGHGAHCSVEFDLPNCLLPVEVDNRGTLLFYRTADRVLAVRCDEHVMHASVDGNALHARERSRVDHINDARIRPDTYQYPASVCSNCEVVTPSAE